MITIELVDRSGHFVTCKTPDKPIGGISVIIHYGRFYCFHQMRENRVVFMEVNQPAEFNSL